jgi:Spy/CpxP family protein refolding chaperone
MKRLGLLVIGLVLIGSNAWAFRGGCGMGPGMGTGPGMGMNPRIASELNLSEDQQAQIQSKQEAFMEGIAPLRNEMLAKREELRQLWAKSDPDQSLISAKQEEIRSIQAQMQERATQHRLDCREVLTPEQREKIGTLTTNQCGWGGGNGRGMHRWQTSDNQ